MKKSLVLLTVIIALFAAINFLVGTRAIQKLQQERPSSFTCLSHDEEICQKNVGFDAWLAFYFIPLLGVISVYIAQKAKINPAIFASGVLFCWITLLELVTRAFHIPALYHSLERSSLHYSLFFVQHPLTIYPGGILISDQMKMLAIIILISFIVGTIFQAIIIWHDKKK